MTRSQFLDLLIRMISDDVIGRSEAEALLRRFDSGDLDPSALPLPLDLAINGLGPGDMEQAATLVRSLEGGPEQARDDLQDWYEQQATELADTASESPLDWHAGMVALLVTYLAAQHIAAGGGSATPALRQTIRQQLAYLSRFAEGLAIGALAGKAMSVTQITQRAHQYSGAGRVVWSVTWEERHADDTITVYDYESADDDHTCGPCLQAEIDGPYLPGEGAFPGSVCLGKGRCRCRRVPRVAPQEAARLRGLP